MVPLAKSAMSPGMVLRSTLKTSIACPDTPITSLATEASLMLAASSTFWSRFTKLTRSRIKLLRWRVKLSKLFAHFFIVNLVNMQELLILGYGQLMPA
ncbi:hypothetical protein H6G96_03295 [Nostoc sp. FACHB-892]|uniref:hypothetical protein n=1 Tax=Nostoc sp. FACHB-892 TaxID=2692843 RepID=UPI001683CE82|nr:hypothetical protein [Nostoc sp. FACHB-892]MBD2725369.1 hypothetical protein [Nostoc sp. FACHB-892]